VSSSALFHIAAAALVTRLGRFAAALVTRVGRFPLQQRHGGERSIVAGDPVLLAITAFLAG